MHGGQISRLQREAVIISFLAGNAGQTVLAIGLGQAHAARLRLDLADSGGALEVVTGDLADWETLPYRSGIGWKTVRCVAW